MTRPPTTSTGRAVASAGNLSTEIRTFALSLRAAGKKPKTIRTYTEAAVWLAQRRPASSWSQITRKDIREHMAWLVENYSPATPRISTAPCKHGSACWPTRTRSPTRWPA